MNETLLPSEESTKPAVREERIIFKPLTCVALKSIPFKYSIWMVAQRDPKHLLLLTEQETSSSRYGGKRRVDEVSAPRAATWLFIHSCAQPQGPVHVNESFQNLEVNNALCSWKKKSFWIIEINLRNAASLGAVLPLLKYSQSAAELDSARQGHRSKEQSIRSDCAVSNYAEGAELIGNISLCYYSPETAARQMQRETVRVWIYLF